jgi:hypothetical protein
MSENSNNITVHNYITVQIKQERSICATLNCSEQNTKVETFFRSNIIIWIMELLSL